MKDFLVNFGMILAVLSFFAFLIGFIMVFFKNQRKFALKLMLFSIISFIIGFSTCAMNFRLGPMH